jgi:UDP-N-acetylmuramoylalanine--D-glutamate ligase
MNFELPEFNGKAVIFIGKGREAQSFETFIKANAAPSSYLSVFLQDDPASLESIRNIDITKTVIVKTVGWPGRLVHNAYTTPTKIFFECVKQIGAQVIGITGTKGKTTTTMLLGEMLKTTGKDVRVCGNMGDPMLDHLEGATNETLFVVELSSYMLAELEVSPHIAIVTNLYNDHVDYHGSLEAYWEAKHNIMRYMTAQDTLIYNPEFDAVNNWIKESPCQTIAIGQDQAVDINDAKLLGAHNGLNAAMALAAAKLVGANESTCLDVIKNFEPVRHRLQKVAVKNGVTYIDDAIGSNPEATIAGISTVVREVGPISCLFLGGQDREYEYWPLMQLISRLAIPYIVLFPETGEKIKRLKPNSYNVEFFETSAMDRAVLWASEKCPKDTVCLLSTAAPSYSIWKDFEEKGDLFQQAVLAIPDKEETTESAS